MSPEKEPQQKNLNQIIKEEGGLIDLENVSRPEGILVGGKSLRSGGTLTFHESVAPKGKTEWKILDIRQPEDHNYQGHNYTEGYTEVVLGVADKDFGFNNDEVLIYTSDQIEAMKGNIKELSVDLK